MTLDESIQGMRLQVIRRAAELTVSAACREAGISRTLFYRWQNRLALYGVDGLRPRRHLGRPGPMSRLTPAVERQILAVAIAQATWAVAGWPLTLRAGGDSRWRRARCSACCVGTAWGRGAASVDEEPKAPAPSTSSPLSAKSAAPSVRRSIWTAC